MHEHMKLSISYCWMVFAVRIIVTVKLEDERGEELR
jgi:hypothetical protein